MAKYLPAPPAIRVHIRAEQGEACKCDKGFVRVARRSLSLTYPDGETSKQFAYDEAYRVALDAVAFVPYVQSLGGELEVYLRSSVRPPAVMRPAAVQPIPEGEDVGLLWEIPAGLVEEHERSELGLKECAARELEEEIGFSNPAEEFEALGAAMFPTPGLIGERIFFYAVKVDPSKQGTPSEDGSPLESGAMVIRVSLEVALKAIDNGEIEDMKTEIGLRRLAARSMAGK